MNRQFILFFLILLLRLINTVSAQTIIELNPRQTIYSVGKSVYFYKDESNLLGIKEISDSIFQKNFQLSTQNELNFSYSKATYWLRLQLKVSSESFNIQNDSHANDWFLEISYPLLDYIDLYYWDYNEWQVKKAGDMISFKNKEIQHRLHIFHLEQPNNLVQTYYLRIKTESPFNIPLQIYRASEFYESNTQSQLGYGIFVGILLLVIINSLFIFLAIREEGYLYYILYTIVVLSFNLILSGHFYQYFFTYTGGWQNTNLLVFFAISFIFSAFYALNFLEVHKYSGVIRRLLIIWIVVSSVLIPASFFLPYSTMSRICQLGSLLTLFLVLIVGILILRKGNQAARYYVFAHILYFILVIPPILKNYALLPTNFFTVHGIEMGKLAEIFFLSIALADRTRLERKKAYQEKEEAQKQIIKVQKEANENLERKVEERTYQLKEAYDELQASEEEIRQNAEVLAFTNANLRAAQDKLQVTFDEIDQKNRDITASINYAFRIQTALLPLDERISGSLNEYFILFKPRDIVSGDYYWFTERNDKIIIMAIDCTGHGVPGAFMSMIADSLLNNIILDKEILDADLILNEMHKSIRKALKQDISDNKDGMDLALCIIDKQNKILEFAGAHNPLIIIQNNELNWVKANPFAIGGFQHEEHRFFTKHSFDISQPTSFYIFTDGYQDQFGGAEKKKFLPRRLRDLIMEIYQKPMSEQRIIMNETIEKWMEGLKQVDDILVIGVKV